jgi:ribonuclease HI
MSSKGARHQQPPEVVINIGVTEGAWLVTIRRGRTTKTFQGVATGKIQALELWSVIVALDSLKEPSRVRVRTSSHYLVECATKWLSIWVAAGWRNAEGNAPKHLELWQKLHELLQLHCVSWKKISNNVDMNYAARDVLQMHKLNIRKPTSVEAAKLLLPDIAKAFASSNFGYSSDSDGSVPTKSAMEFHKLHVQLFHCCAELLGYATANQLLNESYAEIWATLPVNKPAPVHNIQPT